MRGKRGKRGVIRLERITFREGAYVIGVSLPYTSKYLNKDGKLVEELPNIHSRAFRVFMNQCVGSPNLTIYKTKEKRDERLKQGILILVNAGYVVCEKPIRKT
jgi:hypothetical protein